MILANFLQLLEQSSVASSIRQSSWLYPFLEIIHLIGIVVLVGPALMYDLRLLGFSKHLSLEALEVHLLRWSQRGLWLVIPSGLLLFSTNAEELAADRVFWLKMILLALAGLNALFFHQVILTRLPSDKPTEPAAYKIVAIISILLWTAIISCGRLLAY